MESMIALLSRNRGSISSSDDISHPLEHLVPNIVVEHVLTVGCPEGNQLRPAGLGVVNEAPSVGRGAVYPEEVLETRSVSSADCGVRHVMTAPAHTVFHP